MGNQKKKNTGSKRPSVITVGIITAVVILVISGIVAVIHVAAQKDKTPAEAAMPKIELVKASDIDFAENEAARFGDVAFSMEEFLLYAIPIVNQYDETYGADMWATDVTYSDGTTMPYEDYVKCDIIDTAACVKALSAKYQTDFGDLSEAEEQQIYDTAQTYYNALVENGVDAESIGLMTLYGYTYENYRAEKEYTKLFGENADPESEEVINRIAEIVSAFKGEGFTTSRNVNWKNLDILVLNPNRLDTGENTVDTSTLLDGLITEDNVDEFENTDPGDTD